MAGPMNGVYGGGGAMMMDGGNDKRGQKRVASDSDLSDLQRFEKRLRALSIKNEETSAEKNSKPIFHKRVPSKPGILATGFKRSTPPTTPYPARSNDGMQIDDTRDRVYIADLDAELADASSSDDEKLIFLPDIERRFNRLPRQVYEPTASPDHGPQELVLYSDPKSLSVAEGHDSVRKAVVEARQRAREKAAAESRLRQEDMERSYSAANMSRWGATNGDGVVETAHGYGDAGYISPLRLDHDAETDPDAMDIG